MKVWADDYTGYRVTGIDSLKYLKSLPNDVWEMIDTVVWDPPYYDTAGKNNWNNGNTKKSNFNLNTMVANKDYNRLKEIINDKSIKNVVWIKFHTDLRELNLDNKILIWNKNDRHHQMLNGHCEYIEFTTIKPLYWKTKIFNGPANLGRACAKPTELYRFLFEIIGSKYILDPFAGYGMSIKAGLERGCKIYACDIDETLEWGYNYKPRTVETTLEEYF